jgi:hypothetical protein
MITEYPNVNRKNEYYFIRLNNKINLWEFENIYKKIYLEENLGNYEILKKTELINILKYIINEIL